MSCTKCDDTGLFETCDADGGNCSQVFCNCWAGESRADADMNEAERDEDNGSTYADPRDEMDERMFGGD